MTDRLTAAEEQIAHLSRIVDELSEVAARQETEIARLHRRVGQLIEREADQQADTGTQIPLADQRPPHW